MEDDQNDMMERRTIEEASLMQIFSNHDIWEIGLKQFVSELDTEAITLYIAPLKEDAKVNVESTMAARMEEVNTVYAQLRSISFAPVYERKLFEF